MALYITFKDGTESCIYVGTPLSTAPNLLDRIDTIQADGYELEQAYKIVGKGMTPIDTSESYAPISMVFPNPWASLILLNWK